MSMYDRDNPQHMAHMDRWRAAADRAAARENMIGPPDRGDAMCRALIAERMEGAPRGDPTRFMTRAYREKYERENGR